MNLLHDSPFPPLLPNEPRIADTLQQTLTERFLMPALPALQTLFDDLRALADPVLAASAPVVMGRPYPQDQSMAITATIHEMLRDPDAAALPGPAADGYRALRAFVDHGGSLRQVWGASRGTHVHYAFLFGTLCIDVAADAIAPGARKVTIEPFHQARLTPVRDHRHFALLARSAWGATVYPNHVMPGLAPYAPLLMVLPDGSVRIEADAAYMGEMALAGGFTSSASVLDDPAMPSDLFDLVAGTLREADIATAADAAQGRRQALDMCVRYRDKRRRAGDLGHVRAQESLAKANALLATLQVPFAQKRAA